jgi:hypothetical protein
MNSSFELAARQLSEFSDPLSFKLHREAAKKLGDMADQEGARENYLKIFSIVKDRLTDMLTKNEPVFAAYALTKITWVCSDAASELSESKVSYCYCPTGRDWDT